NPDDAALRAWRARPRKFRTANDASNHAIAVHGGTGVFRRNKKIGLPRFLVGQKGVAGLMHAQLSSDKIGCVGQDVSIFPDTRDFAFLFQIAEGASHFVTSLGAITKRVRDFDFIHRPIFRFPNESLNLCVQISFSFACHGDATVRCSWLVFQRDLLGRQASSEDSGVPSALRREKIWGAHARRVRSPEEMASSLVIFSHDPSPSTDRMLVGKDADSPSPLDRIPARPKFDG